jgi:hypothetical protein
VKKSVAVSLFAATLAGVIHHGSAKAERSTAAVEGGNIEILETDKAALEHPVTVANKDFTVTSSVLTSGVISQLVTPVSSTISISQLGPIQIPIWWFKPNWKCVHWNHTPCSSTEMANPWYRQVLILASGFQDADYDVYWSEFDRVVDMMTNAGTVWSTQKRDQLLFFGYFTVGGALNTDTATFGGAVNPHPIRGFALTLSNDAVYNQVDNVIRKEITHLHPLGVGVLFNTFQTGVTANAAPPSFTGRAYGVAKFTREDLNERGSYITSHEMAHASMNFLDEYVEAGLENLNIRSLDALTPLALFDWTWSGLGDALADAFGIYDYNISEILANNGNVNIALSSWPATVGGGQQFSFPYEHGMFFGRGTFHAAGMNLMNSNSSMRAGDDGFGFAHSAPQQNLIDVAFTNNITRANDRLRNAGPKNGWPLALGSTTHVMLFDGDKLNHFQPTTFYDVQVGWYDRQWHTCWWGPFPYACYDDVWKTAETYVLPADRSIDLKASVLYGLTGLVQDVACAVGFTEIKKPDGGVFKICDQSLDTVATAFLPTFKFHMPYQDVDVPADQWFTTYWWRFRTCNGQLYSGMTGWSSFYRSF